MKNATIEANMQWIIAIYRIKGKYCKLPENIELIVTRKEPQCPYRLMNFLFSDKFSEEFSQLGNVADQVGPDTGKVANNQLFWEGVQQAFEGQDEAYNNMLFVDDEVLSELHHINFRKVVPHSWKKTSRNVEELECRV